MVLLAASYIYYMAASRIWLIVFILLTSLSVYLGAIWIDKINELFTSVKKLMDRQQKKEFKEKILWQKKMVIVLMLLINIGTLAFLKYFNFFADVLNITLFNQLHMEIPMLKLFLPIRYFLLYITSS